jgi:hypothetical protein
LNGDDAELDRAEAASVPRTTQPTWRTALADVEQQLEALERKKEEIADQKVRAQTTSEIELVVRNMTEAAVEFDTAAARLSEHTARAVPWLFEVRGVDDFVNVGRAQVPPAVDMVATMLRAYAEDVVSGKAPGDVA